MPSLDVETITIIIFDNWITNHTIYVLCEVVDKMYLLERKF